MTPFIRLYFDSQLGLMLLSLLPSIYLSVLVSLPLVSLLPFVGQIILYLGPNYYQG